MATTTKDCPYCLGKVPSAARKCQHCGEWLTERHVPDPLSHGTIKDFFESDNLDDTLNTGLKWYVKYRIMMAAIGFVVFLIFLLGVWLPNYNKIQNDFDNFDRNPGFSYPDPMYTPSR
jgi:hypothetical protein